MQIGKYTECKLVSESNLDFLRTCYHLPAPEYRTYVLDTIFLHLYKMQTTGWAITIQIKAKGKHISYADHSKNGEGAPPVKLGMGLKLRNHLFTQNRCPFPSVAGFFPGGKLAIWFFTLLFCFGGEGGLCLREVLIPPTRVQQLGITFAVKHVKICSANN